MPRRYFTLDVFTKTAMAGNPLAVILDSDGLDDQAMQIIAREFNLSETVFLRPPQGAGNKAALRIFTPSRELPFAGHPTIGTAVLLSLLETDHDESAFVLEERVGLVPTAARKTSVNSGEAIFSLPRLPERIENAASDVDLACALNLRTEEIGFDHHRPSVFSAGVGFTFVPVRDAATVAMARIDHGHWKEAIRPKDHANAFVYCRETHESGHQFHARMFAPDLGIGEDPATGGAVAAFAGVLMGYEALADGQHRFVIEQGYEMKRPSQILLEMEVSGGALVTARIGGSAVIISDGQLHM
jgi:trans-2,3-dihydro-3-hydroxyanthranilate isomerase